MRLSAASQRLKRRTALSLPPARHRSYACQIDAGGDQDDVDPICFVWPLPEERYCKQRRQRRHQGSKSRATRRAKDGNRAAIQKEGDNGHENALEDRLNCHVGARDLREAGSVQREVDGRRDRERRGGDKCRRVKWIEFRLPHDHGEACPQECRGQEERMADGARGAPAPACQPTMTRAPASKEESSNFRAVESLSPRTIAAGRRTPQAPGPGRCHRGREPPSVGEVSPHLPSARRRAAPRRLAGGTPTLYRRPSRGLPGQGQRARRGQVGQAGVRARQVRRP